MPPSIPGQMTMPLRGSLVEMDLEFWIRYVSYSLEDDGPSQGPSVIITPGHRTTGWMKSSLQCGTRLTNTW
jgi:hypothetical protein